MKDKEVEPMSLFPTLGSLQEVVDLAESRLPITNKNEITSILMTFKNTLLKLIKEQNKEKK